MAALTNIFFGLEHYGFLPYPARLEKMEPWTAFTCVGIALALSIWFVAGIIFSIITECKYSPKAITRKKNENYGLEVEDLLQPPQELPLKADYGDKDEDGEDAHEIEIDSDDDEDEVAAVANNKLKIRNISPTKPFICFLVSL